MRHRQKKDKKKLLDGKMEHKQQHFEMASLAGPIADQETEEGAVHTGKAKPGLFSGCLPRRRRYEMMHDDGVVAASAPVQSKPLATDHEMPPVLRAAAPVAAPSVPSTPDAAAPVVLAQASPVPVRSTAAILSAALHNLNAAGIQVGQRGWVHFQFTIAREANAFVSRFDLHSENPTRRDKPKGFDVNRTTGVCTVRLSYDSFKQLRERTELPEYHNLEPAPRFKR
ncbi:MAG: hypothetical protein P1U63_12310 [Coxiellaceae bacterium]|nr:hypothetical protein [Coxiellaceae bacterium]